MPEERNPILASFKNIFNITELRNRLLIMLGLLFVYRVGSHVPVPGIDHKALEAVFGRGGTLFNFLDVFAGGNLRRFSIFALGIMPYITASIILQLLTVVVPYLEKLSKEGELGRKKITEYTRYLTVVLTLFQGFMFAVGFEKMNVVLHAGWGFRLMTMITLSTGTAFIMWIGEQITERGVGNGISLIIFAGIVAGLPSAMNQVYVKLATSEWSIIHVGILLAVMIATIAGVVYVERGQRKIPIQYAKRVVGRKVMGGQSTHLPLRVNAAGVIPVIFAASIVAFPMTFQQAFPNSRVLSELGRQLGQGMPLYNLLYVVGIIIFTFFYVGVIYNPTDVADNIRKYGGFIPGIRPGQRTAELIDRILGRLTFAGAIYLVLICLLPEFMITGFKLHELPTWLGGNFFSRLPDWFLRGLGVNFYFGGTSLLIVVGVAMDTLQQIESQLIMRHYEGFLKKGRIRGRR
ncbi:MAG: preprotein translocase subunit SecY [Acidobacteria bacterium]|nr:preprotein translocase subunit SecY [Acidobacteriota bacterium]MBI3657637.1 preprotein translocase subunit SecY [Acidobacteriota bacterium]